MRPSSYSITAWAFLPALFTLATLASVGTAGCSYDPKIQDGQLQCSPNGECPSGYSCRNNSCFANGSGTASGGRTGSGGATGSGGRTGSGGSTAVQDGGLGGDAIPPAVIARFVGRWTLAPTSAVATRCDDGFMGTTPLSPVTNPSIMTITPGVAGQSDLESTWLCPLSLGLDQAGAHLFDANPSCSSAAGMNPMQTWTAMTFDIVANNGVTAMHTAKYTRVDRYTNGTVVTCMQDVTAPLVKN